MSHAPVMLRFRRCALSWLVLVFSPLAAGAVTHESLTVEAPFPMPALQVPVFPERDFVITDFGAAPGAATTALRKAIAACHAAGGGRVVVPAGVWRTGAVHLKSHVNLHLAVDAVLEFSDKPEDYLPAVRSSWEGMECYNYSPLVYAFECQDVAVTGPGTLQARLDGWKPWMSRPPAHLAALRKLYTMASTDVPVDERRMAADDANLRPQFIQFNRCRNVLIENMRIRNSPFWTIHLLLCDSVVVRGCDIRAHSHNNDGIDPEMTRNLLVENCRFDQGDDAIAIKSGRNRDGWRLATPTENVVIRGCTVVNGHQLVAIGSELSGGVRNVHVSNCRWESNGTEVEPYNLLYIKTNRRRGGVVENIIMENIDAADASFRMGVLGIETDVLYQWRKLVPTHEERLTEIRGIIVENVRVGRTATPFKILGDKDMPVRDVVLKNIAIETVRGQKNRYEHAGGVRETSIRIGNFHPQPDKENGNK